MYAAKIIVKELTANTLPMKNILFITTARSFCLRAVSFKNLCRQKGRVVVAPQVLGTPPTLAANNLNMCGNTWDKPDIQIAAIPACNISQGSPPHSADG